jgi:hypothetical protein
MIIVAETGLEGMWRRVVTTIVPIRIILLTHGYMLEAGFPRGHGYIHHQIAGHRLLNLRQQRENDDRH